ncbi:MAG: Tfp pilus assembly protein FimT/FimU [Xenococcus sp. (in: cyanobacteria)]
MKVYSSSSSKTNSRGFTLIEMIAAVIILGILAALSFPSLMGLFTRYRVRNAMITINGGIKEAQRQATRQGIICTVNIDKVQRTMTGNPGSCLSEIKKINDNLDIRSNFVAPTTDIFSISFSAKGNTNDGGTIVVSSEYTDTQRCFVIGAGLGITRTGEYTGDKADLNPGAGDCDSNQ